MPLSVAAACNSKLNPRQKRLRSARPQALLMRPPKGACKMSCIPPPSSKNRSAIIVDFVGTLPRTARPATMYETSCCAPHLHSPHSSINHPTVDEICGCAGERNCGDTLGVRCEMSLRSSLTPSDNTSVRCGASPVQNGTLGGAPCASSTCTCPEASILCTRQLVLPSRITSPGLESTAKCSSSVAI